MDPSSLTAQPRNRRQPIRFGPIVVSSATLAWGLSVAVHGAVIAAGYWILHDHTNSGPTIQLAHGDASAEGGYLQQPGLPAQPAAPMSILPDVPSVTATASLPDHTAQQEEAECPISYQPPPDPVSGTAADNPERVLVGVTTNFMGEVQHMNRETPPGAGRDTSGGTSSQRSSTPSGAIGVHQGAGSGSPGVPVGVVEGSAPPLVYPEYSRGHQEQGDVKVAVLVLPDGSIGRITILSDPGYPRLVQAAIDVVRRTRFRPAREGGRAVAAEAIQTFAFRLR